MKFLTAVLLSLVVVVPVQARPAERSDCNRACVQRVKAKIRHRHQVRVRRAHERVFEYYKHHDPMPTCTYVGESSPPGDYSHPFGAHRYTVSNSQGSGAYGKYQMMPRTYATYARWHDWSPADQELSAHRLYHHEGLWPWHKPGCG